MTSRLGWGVALTLAAVLFSTRHQDDDLRYWKSRARSMERESAGWKSETRLYARLYYDLKGTSWAEPPATSPAQP
jgi:hypothetical protein